MKESYLTDFLVVLKRLGKICWNFFQSVVSGEGTVIIRMGELEVAGSGSRRQVGVVVARAP